jgi:hypothetical protein
MHRDVGPCQPAYWGLTSQVDGNRGGTAVTQHNLRISWPLCWREPFNPRYSAQAAGTVAWTPLDAISCNGLGSQTSSCRRRRAAAAKVDEERKTHKVPTTLQSSALVQTILLFLMK